MYQDWEQDADRFKPVCAKEYLEAAFNFEVFVVRVASLVLSGTGIAKIGIPHVHVRVVASNYT